MKITISGEEIINSQTFIGKSIPYCRNPFPYLNVANINVIKSVQVNVWIGWLSGRLVVCHEGFRFPKRVENMVLNRSRG